jgi:hypothetical protein
MNWKTRGLGLLAVVALAGAFAAMPANAVTPVNGTGTLTKCTMGGTVTFKPALKTAAQTVTTTITVAVKCSGGTGDGANVVSGSSKGTETKTGQSCGSLGGTTTHSIKDTTSWVVKTGKRPINPSKGTLTSVTTTINNSTGAITFDAKGKVNSGSFSKSPLNDIAAHALVKETFQTVATQCGGAGVSTLHIKPASTFKIT